MMLVSPGFAEDAEIWVLVSQEGEVGASGESLCCWCICLAPLWGLGQTPSARIPPCSPLVHVSSSPREWQQCCRMSRSEGLG